MVARQVSKPTCESKYELVFVHVTQKFRQPCQAEILFTSMNVLPHTHTDTAETMLLWQVYRYVMYCKQVASLLIHLSRNWKETGCTQIIYHWFSLLKIHSWISNMCNEPLQRNLTPQRSQSIHFIIKLPEYEPLNINEAHGLACLQPHELLHDGKTRSFNCFSQSSLLTEGWETLVWLRFFTIPSQ